MCHYAHAFFLVARWGNSRQSYLQCMSPRHVLLFEHFRPFCTLVGKTKQIIFFSTMGPPLECHVCDRYHCNHMSLQLVTYAMFAVKHSWCQWHFINVCFRCIGFITNKPPFLTICIIDCSLPEYSSQTTCHNKTQQSKNKCFRWAAFSTIHNHAHYTYFVNLR